MTGQFRTNRCPLMTVSVQSRKKHQIHYQIIFSRPCFEWHMRKCPSIVNMHVHTDTCQRETNHWQSMHGNYDDLHNDPHEGPIDTPDDEGYSDDELDRIIKAFSRRQCHVNTHGPGMTNYRVLARTSSAVYCNWIVINELMSPSDALKHPFLTGDASEVSLGSAYLQNIGDFYSGNVLKKMIVNNMIVDMGRDEKKILIRAFREIDLDRNGFIERDEIITYLKKCGRSTEDAKQAATQMMNVMDPRKTGQISLQDYVRAKTVAKLQENETNMLKDTYQSLSKGDVLAADTFREWMKENDPRLNDNQLDEIINGVDADHNGFIDFDEFETALKSVDDIFQA
eukprot:1136156_1